MAKTHSRFKQYLFTGLALIMPVVVTLYVLIASFRFVDNILGFISQQQRYQSSETHDLSV